MQSLISMPEKWGWLGCSTKDRINPGRIIQRGSRSFLVWLLVDLCINITFLASFLMQYIYLPFSYRHKPETSPIIMAYVHNQPKPKPDEKLNDAGHYCNELLDLEGMTLSLV